MVICVVMYVNLTPLKKLAMLTFFHAKDTAFFMFIFFVRHVQKLARFRPSILYIVALPAQISLFTEIKLSIPIAQFKPRRAFQIKFRKS